MEVLVPGSMVREYSVTSNIVSSVCQRHSDLLTPPDEREPQPKVIDFSKCHYRVDPSPDVADDQSRLPPIGPRRSSSEAQLECVVSPLASPMERRYGPSLGQRARQRREHSYGAPRTGNLASEDPSSPSRRSSLKPPRRPPTEASTPSVVSSAGFESPQCSRPSSTCDLSQIRKFGWICGKSIGSGSYGYVFKAMEKQTGRIFAVKKAKVDENDKKYADRLQEELLICKDLRHPNIVACLGFDRTDSDLFIYLEYVPGGSMSSLLAEFGPLDNSLLRSTTSGLLEGLHYLHSRSPPVVHRDIKGANILVDLNFKVKLADFGCSKRNDLTKSFTTIGSIPWMAPEVILQQQGHGRKADVWSFGCVIIEMATAEKPWGKDAFENYMFALRRIAMTDSLPPIPDTLDEIGKDLVSLCIQRDPEVRPSVEDLLGHPFLMLQL